MVYFLEALGSIAVRDPKVGWPLLLSSLGPAGVAYPLAPEPTNEEEPFFDWGIPWESLILRLRTP